jgi:RNA-directed DNA polymerase
MMNGLEKSDAAIRAKKPANKAGQPAAEWVEQRAGTKGNTGQPRTCRAQHRGGVSQGLERVRKAARQRKKEKFTALLHHVTVDQLREAFYALTRNAAPGVDDLRWGGLRGGTGGKSPGLTRTGSTRSVPGTARQTTVYTEVRRKTTSVGDRCAGR